MYDEQRVHARIHISTEIEIATPGGRVPAVLKDLSKGGARVLTPHPVGAVGSTLELFLPSLTGQEITVTSDIIRATEGPNGWLLALRFDVIEPAMRQQLLDLIEVLLTTTAPSNDPTPRVMRRMDISYVQLAELRAILEDIARGGLAMTVAAPLVLHEDLEVTVPDTAGEQLLILHARVVQQRPVEELGQTVFRVGLEFGELRPETLRCVQSLLFTVRESLGDVTEAGS
jgi:c-di-GMP-binding flagellar brake protein YcgR